MEPSTDRFLRFFTIFAWIPAICLLSAHAATEGSRRPGLAIGIAPISISAIVGIVHVAGKAKYRVGNFIMDLFCALFLIAVLIPSFVSLVEYRGDWNLRVNRNSVIMLGSYGTMPLIMNFIVHTFFVFREISLQGFGLLTCPHCHGELGGSSRATHQYQHANAEETLAVERNKESPPSGRFVDAEDGRASSSQDVRPSIDDESARLL